ncbi:hypothetical protein [Catenovulum adriaticum]|uniref:Ig-like domain-containing protein n=1 Tax=Catenovulum adriaticum TaxID=2984846 RepID=A0ABY7AHI9_9ALTE|nr:hypothetical protein [Catenovulum sp. TS8]WAJ69078.1 Ig-like domain-containing protein [Catenovulum sp. TS8]
MLKLFRYWLFVVISLTLTACGGGGSLENGDTDENADNSIYKITITAIDSQGEESHITSQSNPLTVLATLTKDGEPAANKIITFSTPVGILEPSTGNRLTGSDGVAEIKLKPGNQANSGTLTATFSTDDEDITESYPVESLGDGEDDDPTGSGFSISAQSYICDDSSLSLVSEIEQCTQSSEINQASPLYFVVTVESTANQQPVANKLITASAGTGKLLPENGNAISNDDGKAIFRIYSNGATGADEIIINYDTASESFVYQVNTTTVTPTHGYQLAAQLVDVNGNEINQISEDQPGIIKVTLTNQQSAVANNLINVSTSLGSLNPSSGDIVTDAQGEASLTLGAGQVESAGTVSISTQVLDGINTIDLSESIVFSSAGDAQSEVSTSQSLNLNLYESDGVTTTFNISQSNPGILEATLLDENGDPLENKVVTYSATIGEIFPSIGTALTDENGQAYVDISAGTVKGAGTVTVNYNNVTDTLSFTSEGDDNLAEEEYDIAVNFYDCDNNANAAFDIANCSEVDVSSVPEDGVAQLKITRAGSSTPIQNKLISASVDFGSLSPSTGRVITDENGLAYVTLFAGNESGARTLTVNANNSSKSVDFSIISPVILMGNNVSGDFENEVIANNLNGALAIGNTAVLTIDLVNQSDLSIYDKPVVINLNSTCVEAGTAFIDASVTAINGRATAIYRSDSCKGSDVITAEATVGSTTLNASTTISLAQADASYIKFIEASIDGDTEAFRLSYPGTGLASQADLVFQVLGNDNNPLANQEVVFSVTAEGAGIEVTPEQARSDSEGKVYIKAKAGRAPTPLVVLAELVDENGDSYSPKIQAVSRRLAVSTGLADQNSVSLSVETLNIETWSNDGEENPVTIRLADHFNNPVPDGTAISFITHGGEIEPNCLTDNGACSVIWTGQNERPTGNNLNDGMCDVGNDNDPANDVPAQGVPCYDSVNLQPLPLTRPRSGRANILAYAVGEESFVDSNGNGYYDSNETFADLSEAFLDHNEDNQFCGRLADGTAAPGALPVGDSSCLAGGDHEEPVDFNKDFTYNRGNNLFDGILCENDNNCTRNFVHVRDSSVIVMSGSEAYFNVRDSAGNSVTLVDLTTASGQPAVSFTAYITDINNNPMPAGTTVSLSIDNGEISGPSSYDYPNTATPIPQGFSFTLKQESEPNGTSSGIGTITVTSPLGVVSSYQFSIVDDG